MHLLHSSSLVFLFLFFVKSTSGQVHDLDAYRSAIKELTGNAHHQEHIPVGKLETKQIFHLILGAPKVQTDVFRAHLNQYTALVHQSLPLELDFLHLKKWLDAQDLNKDPLIILELWGIGELTIEKLNQLSLIFKDIPLIKVSFEKKPDGLIPVDLSDWFDVITTADYWPQSLVAQLIFGGFSTENGEASVGTRLGYAPAASVEINHSILRDSIKKIIGEGIEAGAFPGAQVLVARKGKVIFHEAYGTHTYGGEQRLSTTDLYDLASVTKISSGLAALLKWYGEGKLDLDASLRAYLPESKGSNKANLKMRDILTHQAGLRAWIPFWKGTLRGNSRNPWQKNWDNNRNNDYRFKARTFRLKESGKYNIAVPGGLWLHHKYPDKMASYIFKSPLNAKPGYVYSDFFFILIPRMIQAQTGQEFESYIKNQFYKPLGASTLTWNPLRYFDPSSIVPTERDTFFRMTLLQGNVHDEGAAMLQGISGHAGLFGSANDLAKLMQLYLNKGIYGGERLIEEKAFDTFTRCANCPENHRGIGFDKPQLPFIPGRSSVAKDASAESFGHSGYTGTFVWIDPVEELIYIFLSNRVYPTRERRAIYDLNIRPRIQQSIYNSLIRE
jgi:CubicO group peptidase (beta-lactamase class C family)